MSKPVNILCYCAQTKIDRELLETLKKHFRFLIQEELIRFYDDANINAGLDSEKESERYFDCADIILLLVSPDFNSYSDKVKRAIKRHEEDIKVFTILLRPIDYEGAPFAKLPILPQRDGHVVAVTTWPDKDEPFKIVTQQIRLAVKESQIKQTLNEAQILYRKRNYEGAILLYDQIIQWNITYFKLDLAYFGKAKALYAQGSEEYCQKSLEVLKQLENLFSNLTYREVTPDAFFFLKSKVLYRLMKYEDSHLAIEIALNFSPVRDDCWAFKAEVLKALCWYDQAVKAYKRSIELSPDNVKYCECCADLLYSLSRFKDAISMYDQALCLDPENASYYARKGEIYEKWHRYEDALDSFDKAINKENKTINAEDKASYFFRKGEILLKLAKAQPAYESFSLALVDFLKGDKTNNNISRTHAGLASASLYLKKYKLALDSLISAIDSGGSKIDPQLDHKMAIIYDQLATDARAKEQEHRATWSSNEGEKFIKVLNPQKLVFIDTLVKQFSDVLSLTMSFQFEGEHIKSTYVISGYQRGMMEKWDLNLRKKILTFGEHENYIGNIVCTMDNKIILSVGKHSFIRMHSFESGYLLGELLGHEDYVTSVAVSMDGKYLVSGSGDKAVGIWNLSTREKICFLTQHQYAVRCVAISMDGKYIVSGSDDQSIKIWKFETGECLHTLYDHEASVRCAAISMDGKYIISGSDDQAIKVWNLETGKLINTLKGHSSSVTSLVLSANSEYIVSASRDQTIRIWELATGKEVKRLNYHSPVTSVAITPDGQTIVSGNEDGTIAIWGIPTE